ncbi:GP179 protein, partial [Atlantisia rogersi]|nr:GP179 protein [Atlantisia rogersi]
AKGLERGSRSIPPREHPEMEQPHVKPVTGSSHPSTPRAEKWGAEVCPWAPPGGRGPLLRQEAIAAQEDSGVPAKALEKGGSHPEPLSPGGSWGTERVPAKSQSVEVTLGAGGQGSSRAGKGAGVHPGENQAESSGRRDICPWEESEGERWGLGRALGKGSEGDPSCPGKEPGLGKPPAKSPELLKAAPEAAGRAEGRRAEVCPWESREGGSTVRAEICPWDEEGAQPEPERPEGERRRLANPGEGAERPSPGLAGAQQGGIIQGRKADVCPWEVEDQPLPRAEICPWEEPAASAGKERSSQDTCGTSKGENKPGSGGL